ncbi:MAG TPA: YfcE family phosphodiesterase [Candidatus Saccharimonadales bacterium]|nr:YfcE family phosphodiesterase [Candidatus Saccharimonadales bacterium]
MKIGIISDTHDKLPPIEIAMMVFRQHQVAAIIHCGDWTKPATVEWFADQAGRAHLPAYGVIGNNDHGPLIRALNARLPNPISFPAGEVLQLELDGKRITAYHGHHKPTLASLVNSRHYDIVLTGHSHKASAQPADSTLVVNPGSTAFCIPRRKQDLSSVAIYDTRLHLAQIIFLAEGAYHN